MSPAFIEIDPDDATVTADAAGRVTGIHWKQTGEVHEVINGQLETIGGAQVVTPFDPNKPLAIIRPKVDGEPIRAHCFSPYPRIDPGSRPS